MILNPIILDSAMYEKNDPNYLDESQFDKAKACFIEIIHLMRSRYGDRPMSVVDFGCANGAFLHHAGLELNIDRSVGIDISDELIGLAKSQLPDTEFYVEEFSKVGRLSLGNFDVCVCLGTLCLFDDLEIPLKVICQHLTPGGIGIIYDLVNPYPVDVQMRFRRHGEVSWKPAYNVRCSESWQALIRSNDPNLQVKVSKFDMPYPIEKTHDVMRSWTINTEYNDNQIISGTGQLLDFGIITFGKEIVI